PVTARSSSSGSPPAPPRPDPRQHPLTPAAGRFSDEPVRPRSVYIPPMYRAPLVALAILVAGAPLLAQEPAAAAGRCLAPDSIAVRGASRVSPDAVIATSGLSPGDSLSFPTIQRAIRDVFSMGDFNIVEVTCGLPQGDGRVVLVITVEERQVLSRVAVE